MDVDYPGFAGGDRTDIRLPAGQRQLLQALHATGKPVALVLTGGSALAVDWAQSQLPAILMAWYPGQRGGNAVADVLFGDANPAGRLPVTFYKAEETLPAFDDYAMAGRTYRYFGGEPLYPFGHGLSYTRFDYGEAKLDQPSLAADDGQVELSFDLRNTGQRAGEEVVQLYVQRVDRDPADALQDLRGFQRVALQPGQSQRLSFTLRSADLRRYDEAARGYVVSPGDYELRLGASSADIRQRVRLQVRQ